MLFIDNAPAAPATSTPATSRDASQPLAAPVASARPPALPRTSIPAAASATPSTPDPLAEQPAAASHEIAGLPRRHLVLAAAALALIALLLLAVQAFGASDHSTARAPELTGKLIAPAPAPASPARTTPAPAPARANTAPAHAGRGATAAAPTPATLGADEHDAELDEELADEPAPSSGAPLNAKQREREQQQNQARMLVRQAGLYRTGGRLGMAEAAYLKALKLMPRYPLAVAGLVRIHLQRRDATESVRWAKVLIALQPNRGNNQLMLGDAYALAGRKADAQRAWLQSKKYGNPTARDRLR
jgi:hypothetical protein